MNLILAQSTSGPVAAFSEPSLSYYAATNAEQINAQQKAYAEALLEQNRVMKEPIDALQKSESVIESLHGEVERLRKEVDSQKESAPVEEDKSTDDFSF
jgi:TolA-binding protein